MNRTILPLFLILMTCLQGCLSTEAECKKTEAPEINVGLLFFGSVKIKNQSGDDITSEFVDRELNMLYYKVYCDGTNRGPFTTEFTINEDGSLYKESIGYMSFRLDNRNDYIRVHFYIDGTDIGQSYNVIYDQLKAYDGGNPNLNFRIVLEANGIFYSTQSISLTIS